MYQESEHILYYDEAIIAAHKPPWLLSVPGRKPEHKDSLSLRLEQRFGRVFVVHRLDCATSGVMIFARDPDSHRALNKQFQQRQVCKTYQAMAAGRCLLDQGELHVPLRVDWPNRPRQKVDWLSGKPSHTQWRVLERFADQTRFELTPITGRSHQLRVHLKCLGHPILGDRLYAPESAVVDQPRMLLHAQRLQLSHPVSGRVMDFWVDSPF